MHSRTATALTLEPAMNRDKTASNATRTVVSKFGLLAGLAGIEHGVLILLCVLLLLVGGGGRPRAGVCAFRLLLRGAHPGAGLRPGLFAHWAWVTTLTNRLVIRVKRARKTENVYAGICGIRG